MLKLDKYWYDQSSQNGNPIQRKNHCDFIMSGINVHYELLSLARDEIYPVIRLALNHYLKKIQEYSDGYFLTDWHWQHMLGCPFDSVLLGPFHSLSGQIYWFIRFWCHASKNIEEQTVFTVSKHSQMALWKTLSVHSHVWPPFIDPTDTSFQEGTWRKKSGYTRLDRIRWQHNKFAGKRAAGP